jgi:hypothetical protein
MTMLTYILDSVKLPKSFVAINLSEKVPGAFGLKQEDANKAGEKDSSRSQSQNIGGTPLPSPALDAAGKEFV